jgi:hypothetical protein
MSARPAKRSLTCAETAKLIRKALKADFPGTKFSVRSSTYAGGASITVGWTDGPRTEEVDGTLNLYSGATFDGMIDLKEYHDTLLMTDDGPEYVHMGADFVHSSRDISNVRERVYAHELRRFVESLGVEWKGAGHSVRYPVSVVGRFNPDAENAGEWDCIRGSLSHDEHGTDGWAGSIVRQMGYERKWLGEKCPGSDTSYCKGCGRWQKGHEREPHLR